MGRGVLKYSFPVLFILFSLPSLAQPGNDNCVNAGFLCSEIISSGTNVAATAECGGADGDCTSAGTWGQCYDVSQSVWFSFVTNSAGGNATVNISNISCQNNPGTDELQGVLLSATIPCDPATYTTIDCNAGDPATFSLSGTGLSPNTVYFIQIDAGTTPASCTFDISVSGSAVEWIVNTSSTDVSCNGGDDGTATASPQTGQSPYNYQWDAAANNQTGATANNLVAGTYSVTIADAVGCDTSVQVTVDEPQPMQLQTFTNNASCGASDGSAIAAVLSGGTGPFSYEWSNGQSGSTAANLAAGSYSVTVTDDGGCTAVATAVINSDNAPTVNTSATSVSCFGSADGFASATPTGGASPYSLSWSDGQSGTMATGLSAGTYQVEVEDANNCVVTKTVTIGEPDEITGTLSSTPEQCNSANGTASASATGGTAPYAFVWSNGQNGGNISGLTTGNYSVTVSDNNGCTSTGSVFVSEETGLDASVNTNPVSCNGGNDGTASASANSGTSPYTFNWSNGQSGPNATGFSAGSYFVTASDALGCDTVLGFTISEPDPMVVNTTETEASCGGADGSATANVSSGGTSPFSFSWSNGQSGSNATNLAAGSYTVVVTDSEGCTETATVDISEAGAPEFNIIPSDVSCPGGNDGAATVNITSSTGAPVISWSNGASTTINQNLSEGSYSVTVTDDSGCKSVKSTTIEGPDPWSLTTNTSGPGCGQTNGTASVANAGNQPPYTYSWSTGQNGSSINNLGEGTYSVTVFDGNGCDTVLSVVLTEPSSITGAEIGTTDATCGDSDGSAQVTSVTGGQAPYSYSWSNGSNTFSAQNLAAGTYTVTITDDNNCDSSFTASISETAGITTFTTASQPPGCGADDGFIEISSVTGGNLPYSYALNGGVFQASPIFANLGAGEYTVSVKDDSNCPPQEDVVSLEQPEFPELTATAVSTECLVDNGSVTATATGGSSPYVYSLSGKENTTGVFEDLGKGTYQVTVVDEYSCEAVTQVVVSDNACDVNLPPNAFTPNGDGINDTWEIPNLNNYPECRVYVYDRWGQKVLFSKGYSEPWDGKSLGFPVPAATYYYVIRLNNNDKEAGEFKGPVAIIR